MALITVLMGWTPPLNGDQPLHSGTSRPSGGVHPIRTMMDDDVPLAELLEASVIDLHAELESRRHLPRVPGLFHLAFESNWR
jgi:hypothetical protein